MSTTDTPTEATTLSPAQSLAVTQIGEIFNQLKKQFGDPPYSVFGGPVSLDSSLREMAFKIWLETTCGWGDAGSDTPPAPPDIALPGDDDASGKRLLRACRDNAAAPPGPAQNVAASALEVRSENVITALGVMDVLRSDGVIVSNNGPYGGTAIKVPTQPPPTAVHGEPGFGIQIGSNLLAPDDDGGKTGFWFTKGSARAVARSRCIEGSFSIVSVVRLPSGKVELAE